MFGLCFVSPWQALWPLVQVGIAGSGFWLEVKNEFSAFIATSLIIPKAIAREPFCHENLLP